MRRNLFLFVFLCVLGIQFANAQSINGLEIGKQYSLVQIKAALGNPTFIDSWDTEFGTDYEFHYGEDMFRFYSLTGFSDFALRDNKFSINNKFKVGDNVSILSTIPNSKLVLKEQGLYYLYIYPCDDPIKVKFTNNIITYIGFMMSV